MIKVLILGSSGLLGRHLYNELKYNKRINLIHNGLNNRKFNLTKKKQLESLVLSKKPNLIINTIGLTNIEKCENQTTFYIYLYESILHKRFYISIYISI